IQEFFIPTDSLTQENSRAAPCHKTQNDLVGLYCNPFVYRARHELLLLSQEPVVLTFTFGELDLESIAKLIDHAGKDPAFIFAGVSRNQI
ncbi:hypothetical protein L9G74_20835, partial [Shewanella sp. C32]